jgi:hypothetical protein
MMKKTNKILVFIRSAAAVLALGTTLSFQISNAADAPKTKIVHPIDVDYNKSPEPIYKANADTSTLGEAKILSRAAFEKIVFIDEKGTHISTKLTDWATAAGTKSETASAKNGKATKNYEIDNARQVYAVETYYPDGVQTKGGLIENCLDTAIYDAETGKMLAVLHHSIQPGEKVPVTEGR